MKILLTIAFFLSIGVSNSIGQFGDIVWKMTTADLIAEKGEYNKKVEKGKSTRLLYFDYVEGIPGILTYVFDTDSLTWANFISTRDKLDPNYYIYDYGNLHSLLNRVNPNDPFKDQIRWYDEQYLDDKCSHGLAVTLGHLSFFTAWKEEDHTQTELELTQEDENLYLEIFTYSVEKRKEYDLKRANNQNK